VDLPTKRRLDAIDHADSIRGFNRECHFYFSGSVRQLQMMRHLHGNPVILIAWLLARMGCPSRAKNKAIDFHRKRSLDTVSMADQMRGQPPVEVLQSF
jgi:hypothetical protein